MLMSFEDYKKFYFRNKKCIDEVSFSKKIYNEEKLLKRYDRFCEKEQIKFDKKVANMIDVEWEKTRHEALSLDSKANTFWKSLTTDEWFIMKEKCINGMGRVDCAHIFAKGVYPHMKYCIINIIVLPRYFHTLIDQYKNPFTLKNINEEERNDLWIHLIGIERYNHLFAISQNKNI